MLNFLKKKEAGNWIAAFALLFSIITFSVTLFMGITGSKDKKESDEKILKLQQEMKDFDKKMGLNEYTADIISKLSDTKEDKSPKYGIALRQMALQEFFNDSLNVFSELKNLNGFRFDDLILNGKQIDELRNFTFTNCNFNGSKFGEINISNSEFRNCTFNKATFSTGRKSLIDFSVHIDSCRFVSCSTDQAMLEGLVIKTVKLSV